MNLTGQETRRQLEDLLTQAQEEAAVLQSVLDEPGRDLVKHLERQRTFSQRTFGPGDAAERAQGIADHIARELEEVRAKPMDLVEWIDLALLAFDGAHRTGATPEEICAALAAKQERNESRKWPDWRTATPGKAIEHDRSEE